MKRSVSIKICMVCVIMSLMLVVSCGKKKVETAPAAAADTATDTKPADDAANAATDTEKVEDTAVMAADDNAGKKETAGAAAVAETVGVSDIYFDYDSSDILSSETAALEAKAQWLKANPNVKTTIEGHCDERGTSEYNLALGDRRAARAKSFLEKLGISGSRMETVSYGEEKPAVPDHNEDAWSKNRRAHFADK
ncbi:MAG: peptidoglycan-associated lipoprotein Pal [Desulfobacteraceae bacterium]